MSAPKDMSLRELVTLEGGCNGDGKIFLKKVEVEAAEQLLPRYRSAYDVLSYRSVLSAEFERITDKSVCFFSVI